MKSSFCAATLLFLCMFLLTTTARPSDIVLLNSDSVGSPGSGQANGSAVLRQRSSFLNAAAFFNAQGVESIELHLFNDVVLIALQTKVQRGRNGTLLWTGKLVGMENGQIVLIAQDRQVSASIYLPWTTFQIRPKEGGIHLIRELKSVPSFSDDGPAMPLAEERKIVELVNLERSTEGLPSLQYNDRLAATARGHALDMALRDYSSHDRRDGRKFYQCVFDNGYPVSKCGENIVVGLATPEEAFEGLMSSPGHRGNILDSDFMQVGVGHAVSPLSAFRHFWTQDFGAGNKRERSPDLKLGAAHSPMGLFALVAPLELSIHDAPGIFVPFYQITPSRD
ncbi:MAG: CAP domain-containing protein [Syntrophobacteraceae bacterium]